MHAQHAQHSQLHKQLQQSPQEANNLRLAELGFAIEAVHKHNRHLLNTITTISGSHYDLHLKCVTLHDHSKRLMNWQQQLTFTPADVPAVAKMQSQWEWSASHLSMVTAARMSRAEVRCEYMHMATVYMCMQVLTLDLTFRMIFSKTSLRYRRNDPVKSDTLGRNSSCANRFAPLLVTLRLKSQPNTPPPGV